MKCPLNRWIIIPCLSVILAVAGCAGTARRYSASGSEKPDLGEPRNHVLMLMQCGRSAFAEGNYDKARELFNEVVLYMETMFVDTERARKARSLWYDEGSKDFMGEPYERAMSYYYRGLIYLRDGDFGNARACFKSAVLQDAFAEEEQHRCDFALMIFLEGWASQMEGDEILVRKAYKEVQKLRPDFIQPKPGDNILVVVEIGKAPRKVADGPGHGELKFRRGIDFLEKSVRIKVDDNPPANAYPMEDIAWQAASRGGREVDKIVERKVKFRKRNEAMGTALTDVATTAVIFAPLAGSGSDVMSAAGLALGLVGITQMAIAAHANPHADTRYWNNLPDSVHTMTLCLPPGKHHMRVDLMGAQKRVKTGFSRKVIFSVPKNGKPVLVWVTAR